MNQFNHNEAEDYLYERAEKRFQEMKAGRFITNEDTMSFVREYIGQDKRVFLWYAYEALDIDNTCP